MTSKGNKSWTKLKASEANLKESEAKIKTELIQEEAKHDKTKATCGGGLNLLADKNFGKICAEREAVRLLELILTLKNKEMCYQAVEGRQIPVKYKALIGDKYTTKAGKEKQGYKSLYDKDVKCRGDVVPVLDFWVKFNPEIFEFDPTKNGLGMFILKGKPEGSRFKDVVWC